MKFTINNNLRLLTCPLLLAGAVCCSSGNDGDTPAPGPGPDPSPVTGDVLAYVTSADGNRLFTEEGLDYSKVSMSPYRVTIDPSKPYDSWTGGRLNPAYYDDYAEYFVQWVTEMEENGFPIYAITMQNEPLNKGNSMSLYMPWEDQLAFVKKLGPAFRKAGIDTKILCYDHNYNYDNVAGQQNYPLNIYADADAAQWVDGSAWHNYGGSVSELDNIRAAAPDKTIYFTEASIGTWNYNFESCVIDDFESIFLGTLSRYGKGVLLWNLMLDDKGAPNRPGGCTTCYGAIEISSSDYKTLKYNSHYYDLAQCAKVIRPGAVRIGASGYTASGLTYLAFRNPDGSKAFVALNRSAGEQTVAVYENADRSFKYTIPAKSIASFRWGAGAEN